MAILPVATKAGDTAIPAVETASADLLAAIERLEKAQTGKDRVAALTSTLRAYEAGLATLRDARRRVLSEEADITSELSHHRGQIGRLIGALATIEKTPVPLLLLHPDGALGTARSGMMIAAVTPELEAEADALRGKLDRLQLLRDTQSRATDTLQTGFIAAQNARSSLSKAMQNRTDLPQNFPQDPEALASLLASADSLENFADGLDAMETDISIPDQSFEQSRGTLPLPVLGTLRHRAGDPDAAGISRPGIIIATAAGALVTAPAASTVRYSGPLLDYANVMILEPQTGYLIVIAGLATVYGEIGDILAQGAPIGLMGGTPPGSQKSEAALQEEDGAQRWETLYMELRQGTTPVDPAEWFILNGED